MRRISHGFLDTGAILYLPFPVELLKKEAEIHDIIADSGYCLMSFEQPMSMAKVRLDSKSFVRKYGLELIPKLDGAPDDNYIESFVNCLSPYIISFSVDWDLPQTGVLTKALDQLNEKIIGGRKLSMDSRPQAIKLLRKLHTAKLIQ